MGVGMWVWVCGCGHVWVWACVCVGGCGCMWGWVYVGVGLCGVLKSLEEMHTFDIDSSSALKSYSAFLCSYLCFECSSGRVLAPGDGLYVYLDVFPRHP